MITKIYSKSAINDVISCSSTILDALSINDFSSDTYLTELTQKISLQVQKMIEASNESTGNSTLAILDERRDNSLKVMSYEVKSKTLWPDSEIKEAAEKVMEVFDHYGADIIRLPYNHQTAQAKALFEDLKKTEIAEAISVLPGFSALVLRAEEDQNQFDLGYMKYIQTKGESKNEIPAYKLALTVRGLINDELMVYLTSMARINPGLYGSCYEALCTAIGENNSKVKARINKLRNDKLSAMTNKN